MTAEGESIGEAADRLNAALERLEHELQEKGYRVYAFVPLDVSEPEGRRLAYGKLGNNWRLVLEEGEDRTALIQAALLTRVVAIAALSRLREALDIERDHVRVDAIDAADAAEELLEEWRAES